MSEGLWYIGEGKAALRRGAVASGPDLVPVQALYSGLSRGTERLVLEGRVPTSEYARMRCPHQEGDFPFPVKYGYALVGRAASGPLAGKTVFALHPHQREIALPAEALHEVPADVPPRRAVLAANMETALNVIWDSGASAGDGVLIVGGGVLGLLIAALAARLPGTEVTVADHEPTRGDVATRLGAAFTSAERLPVEQDVVIHTSGSPAGLSAALTAAAPEATVVEASWYGATAVPLQLGEAFHARRLKLISSQVGHVPAVRTPRWTRTRRLNTALTLLRDPVFDLLVTNEIAFNDAADKVPAALTSANAALMTALRY